MKQPKKKQRRSPGLGDVVDLLQRIPGDVFDGIRDTRPPEEREGLVEMFAIQDDIPDQSRVGSRTEGRKK
jgi:hypothetical protein